MPKIVDHDQYRKELLRKCFDLFAEKGYGSITMRQIAQGMGVSTGTLYHYFPSKGALFCQLVEEQTRQDILNFLAEAGTAQTLPERMGALLNFVCKNVDYFGKQLLLWMDFVQQQDHIDPLGQEVLKRVDTEVREALADYLQIPDQTVAALILSVLNGLILDYLLDKDRVANFATQGELLTQMLTVYLHQQPLTSRKAI